MSEIRVRFDFNLILKHAMNSFLNDFSQLKTFSAKRAQGKSITKECYYFLNCFLPTFK